jgi:GTP-binding protein
MADFVDLVTITVRSGDGGNGTIAWRREKYEPLGGPAGGDGGRGGDVYLEADNDMRTLLDFRYKHRFEAPAGARGGPKNKYGRAGEPLMIKVPVGTIARDKESGAVIADLVHPGQKVLIAEGGRGGRGNTKLASSTRRAPHYCEPGEPGIERQLVLELKLLADIGIVGLPNAGKSTLLSVLTAARPKIADYPFSTLTPNLGVMKRPDGDGYVIADIPGLVEGASQGVGLGHKFLRHVERTRMLVHLVDMSSPDLEENIRTLNRELKLYGGRLADLPKFIVLNKSDLVTDEERQAIQLKIKQDYRSLAEPVVDREGEAILTVSCGTREGIEELSNLIMSTMANLAPQPVLYEVAEDPAARERVTGGFTIERRKKVFTVVSDRVRRLVEVTNLRDPESLTHLHHVLKAMGVIDALLAEGAAPGSEVVLGGVNFSFGEDW